VLLIFMIAYEEEDGDFIFTRGSKRAKTTPAEPGPAPAPALVSKKGRKMKEATERDNEPVRTVKKPSVRKMDFATPKPEKDTIRLPKRGKNSRSSISKNQTSIHQSRMETTDHDRMDLVGTPNAEELSRSTVDAGKHSTVISLPFSDTPIINRNKELRKKGNGNRRSSLGMRGRRASSLIENGHSAIPHREVETSEFYKHIEASGLSEPRRMKQLLTWTGERALGGKPSHGDPDSAAHLAGERYFLFGRFVRLINAARVIKESLLKDFAHKSEFSDWFSREESVPTRVIKKPNPRNIEIEENLAGIEARIRRYVNSCVTLSVISANFINPRLKEERDEWKALARPPPCLTPLFPDDSTELSHAQIDTSLLDPEQASILATVAESSALSLRNEVSDRLKSIHAGIEFKVDYFADGVHKLEQYLEAAGRVADKIQAIGAVRLEERDKTEKEAVGTRDLPMQEVLRSLSRILPQGSSGSGR
jgi:kinetochore protein Mis13/DSN1